MCGDTVRAWWPFLAQRRDGGAGGAEQGRAAGHARSFSPDTALPRAGSGGHRQVFDL